MLTFEQIKELIDRVASHRLSGFELERSGFRLKIDGQKSNEQAAVETVTIAAPPAVAENVSAPPSAGPPLPRPVAEAPQAAAEAPQSDEPPPGSHVLTSPIVGTFYRSPDPNSPPFAEVGDRVATGQILCIVEAMKLMNEIESDVDGKIVKVYAENAQPVEYGEPLFAIQAG